VLLDVAGRVALAMTMQKVPDILGIDIYVLRLTMRLLIPRLILPIG
jgi:hypothetical protein